MNIITFSLYSFTLFVCLLGLIVSFSTKRNLEVILLSSLLLRIFVIFFFESGVKHQFVIDSMKYEQDAWLMAKNLISNQPEIIQTITQSNLYTWFAGSVFYVFGHTPLILSLFNAIFGILSIYLLIRILTENFTNTLSLNFQKKTNILLAIILTLYPSLLVWTSTNTKDPMTILFSIGGIWSLFRAYRTKSFLKIIGFLFLTFISYFIVFQLRSYFVFFSVIGFFLGLTLIFLSKFLSPKKLTTAVFILTGFCLFFSYLFVPQYFSEGLNFLQQTRMSFSNIGLDDVAQSSFLLHYDFQNLMDLILFIPQALAYYFLGPFPWQVVNLRQALSLSEPLAIIILSFWTFRGIRQCYLLNRSATLLILSILGVCVLSQAITISNLGTLFRHRTFILMFLCLFTVVGFYEKKNC